MRLHAIRRLLRGRKPAQQVSTSVLIASCLALQLSGTLHLAVVEHELCVDHGAAVDVEAGHHHGHAHAGEAGARAVDEVAPAPAPTTRGGESHDHCPVTADRNGYALDVLAAPEGPRSAELRAVEPVFAALWTVSTSELRLLAPKTSPPV